MKKNSCDVVMWTAQTEAVLNELAKNRVSYVKKEYIKKKYGETAWIFETAYDYFIKKFQLCVEKPEEAESPIWLFKDAKWAGGNQGAELLKLRIPAGQMLYFDRKRWTEILNLSYVGTEKEREAFDRELRAQGIADVSDVFAKPYYPAVKSRIIKSWDKVFETEGLDDQDVQGAVWCIRREWIEKG